SAAEIPGPVSLTETWNAPLFASALMAISPASVNLIALPTRLIRTCVKRRPSPRPEGNCGATSTLNPSFLSVAIGSSVLRTVCAISWMQYSDNSSTCAAQFIEQPRILDGDDGLFRK